MGRMGCDIWGKGYIYIDELLLRAGELHGVGDEQPASQIWGTRVIRVWEGIGECVAWAEMIGTEQDLTRGMLAVCC